MHNMSRETHHEVCGRAIGLADLSEKSRCAAWHHVRRTSSKAGGAFSPLCRSIVTSQSIIGAVCFRTCHSDVRASALRFQKELAFASPRRAHCGPECSSKSSRTSCSLSEVFTPISFFRLPNNTTLLFSIVAMRVPSLLAVLTAGLHGAAFAREDGIARTPPMGWQRVRQTADEGIGDLRSEPRRGMSMPTAMPCRSPSLRRHACVALAQRPGAFVRTHISAGRGRRVGGTRFALGRAACGRAARGGGLVAHGWADARS